MNIEMNFMPAVDSRFFFFFVWAYGGFRRSNTDVNIEMNFIPAADSRFFSCMGMWMSMRLNTDLNIEMSFMPAADSRFFMYGHVDAYEIEYRFEY